jgi:hypothetical protein
MDMEKRYIYRIYYKGKHYAKNRPYYKTEGAAKGAMTTFAKGMAWEDLRKRNTNGQIKDSTYFINRKTEDHLRHFDIRKEDNPFKGTYCPHCDAEMRHTVLKNHTFEELPNTGVYDANDVSHIYDCTECPAILFEYLEPVNTRALANYLNRGGHSDNN